MSDISVAIEIEDGKLLNIYIDGDVDITVLNHDDLHENLVDFGGLYHKIPRESSFCYQEEFNEILTKFINKYENGNESIKK
jgi:hypothetical protein